MHPHLLDCPRHSPLRAPLTHAEHRAVLEAARRLRETGPNAALALLRRAADPTWLRP